MTYPQQQAPHPQPSAPLAPPAKTKFGTLAWTALILGIVGVVGSPVIFLNNLTAVIAFVGIVLGAIALFGSKKILAAIGVVLCVAGVAITVSVQSSTAEKLDEIFAGTTNDGRVSPGGTGEPAAVAQAPAAGSPTWGTRYTWKDGLAVDVAAPAACTPGEFAAPQGVVRAVKFTIVITNGTDKPFETAGLSFGSDAQFAGKKAESVFDSNGGCGGGFESSTVMPGKTFTFEQSYSVGAEPGEMQLVLQPGFGSDKAVFTGQV
ncbi:hypothetical protein [Umezawaea sp.]|uniref:hypothetical protein n=1 Tax=Umezawaea sp. TaxID=1955258 RepID=UPI002ED47334